MRQPLGALQVNRLTLIDVLLIAIQALLAGALIIIYINRVRALPRCEREEVLYAGLALALIFAIVYRLITVLN